MSNFTADDVDMLRRLKEQHLALIRSFPHGSNEAVGVASHIDDLADRVEQEMERQQALDRALDEYDRKYWIEQYNVKFKDPTTQEE